MYFILKFQILLISKKNDKKQDTLNENYSNFQENKMKNMNGKSENATFETN